MIQFSARWRLLLFVAAALAILCLSIMPHPPVPRTGIFSWDKLQHAIVYAFLMVLGGWAFSSYVVSKLSAWRYALIFVILYGALMEGLQSLLPTGRSGDPADILANALGGLVSYVTIRLLYCRKSSEKGELR